MNINIDNLRKLAQANRESTAQLDMENFGYIGECGTTYCALGNYAVRADLQSEFKLVSRMPRLKLYTQNGMDTGYDYPAVLEHFGITPEEADELFAEDFVCEGIAAQCKSAQEAADYIDAFIERKLRVQA